MPDEIRRRGRITTRGPGTERVRDADLSLLGGPEPDFVSTDPWRALRILGEFVEGFDLLARVGPAVSVFGSARTAPDDPDYAAAVQAATSVRFGLSSSIFTRDTNTAFRAMRDFDTGIVYINAGTIGSEVHLPFGGVRATGNGHREAGQAALDTFSEWKSIYVDYSGQLQRAQIDMN